MSTTNERWLDNSIQFPRLLCEIIATQDVDFDGLADSMDLDLDDIHDLFDRAHVAWETVKAAAR